MNLDSKEAYFENIKTYYYNRNNGFYNEERINEISMVLTEYFFRQYKDFRKEYPKSRKRYSSLKIDDLENPITHDKIIFYVKDKYRNDYIKFCSRMLNMDEDAFLKYENRRAKFNGMF